LVGAEEGIIPSTRTMNENSGDVTEERRLFYVGMTRAKELLYITSASRRKKYGEYFTAIPSRFIEEIGSDNLISERIEADNSKESSFIEELQKIKNAE
jgi:DNA helicase-2/ATP-dependent DNA helicase PcrA